MTTVFIKGLILKDFIFHKKFFSVMRNQGVREEVSVKQMYVVGLIE